ncbi:MAG: hypothetical protein JNJ88_14735 [Planctomycetes bacterium]|nr:hypothetical protein [Planctomycetota bacterium]
MPLLGPARAAIGGTWRTLYRWSALLRRGLAARSKKHFPSPNPAIPPPPQVTLENRLSYKRAALPGERDYPAPAKEENLWMSDAHFSDATTARNRLGLCGAADGEWLFEYSIDLTADIRELWCPTALDAGTGRSAAAWRRPTSNAPWGFTRDLLTGAEAEREILMLSTDEDHRDLRSLGRVNGAPPDGYLKGL